MSSRESPVTGHVTRVTGQLTDGSRGSLVKKCDPLSSWVFNGNCNCLCRNPLCLFVCMGVRT